MFWGAHFGTANPTAFNYSLSLCRPPSSPAASRITTGPLAAQNQAGPPHALRLSCRTLQMARQRAQLPAESGHAPELAQSCLGTGASHRCAHTKAYGNSSGRRRFSSAIALTICIT